MSLMHTPRLCIDVRAGSEYASKALISNEVVDQLVAAIGEKDIESHWVEKRRTVLLSHPNQVFAGQMKRFDTKRRIGFTPLYWAWERSFLDQAKLSAFHRFRPIDRLQPSPSCHTITTVLPPRRRLPRKIKSEKDHSFLVPSYKDKLLLEDYSISSDQIRVLRPAVRRFARFIEKFERSAEGYILILTDSTQQVDLKKLQRVLSIRFPSMQYKIIHSKDEEAFSPSRWLSILKNTILAFYLSELPFDWPIAVLEGYYFGVPFVFSDQNAALSELTREPLLRLSRFLIDQPTVEQLEQTIEPERQHLAKQGVFDPLAFAKQYRKVYSDLEVAFD